MAWLKIHIKRGLVCLVVLLNMILAGGTNPVLAGEDPGDLFNYSFAVWLGSGVYKVNDANKKFAVLRVPAAYTLRPVQSDQSAPIDRLGFRLLLPAVIGYEGETDSDFDFGAVAFVPGLEVQIPVNKYWGSPFKKQALYNDLRLCHIIQRNGPHSGCIFPPKY